MRTLLCGLLLALAAGASAQAPPSDSLTYDTVMQLPRQDQIRLFNLATPEQKAAIVREQPTRWLAHNRDSLSAEQIAFVQEMIDYVQPSLYDGSMTEEQEVELAAIQERGLSLLSREQVFRAFFAEAPYIPKP